jgi:hypothetical protein
VRIDEAAVGFVEGVGGQVVTVVKLWRDGGREAGDEALHFLLCRF